MQLLLLALAVAIPCWYGYRQSVSQGRVEINHVTTFTFGFLFYWITPLAVRIVAPHMDLPLASVWSGLFREAMIVPYALSCIALYLCFVIGDSYAASRFAQPPTRIIITIPDLALSLVTLFGCVMAAYSTYVLRADFFRRDPLPTLQTGFARGAVTACLVLLGTVALMFTMAHPEMRWRRLLRTWSYLPVIFLAVVMIQFGSRLYVASLLLMFLIYQTHFRARLKLKTTLAVVLLFALGFGLVGTWREGSSPKGALFNVFLEPMEGSLSLVHHLRYKGIAWTNQPTQLISDFANLIPTVLMPDKVKLLKKPDAYRPLGGLHSFVSFNLNFGLLGTMVFLFIWPVLFRYAKSRMAETLFATIYVMCSGWLAFTFFRDAFSISLVKAIFESSLLVPFLIVCFGRLLNAACAPLLAGVFLPHPETEATS